MTDYYSYPNYAPWYSNSSSIKTVTILYGVTSIGDWAFSDCTSLTEFVVGKNNENYNKPKSENSKQPQCPEDKESAIVEALKHFKMIQQK